VTPRTSACSNRVDTFAARQVEDAQLVEGLLCQVANDLHHPPHLDAVGVVGGCRVARGFCAFQREQFPGGGVEDDDRV
jgi:hypothetical protein